MYSLQDVQLQVDEIVHFSPGFVREYKPQQISVKDPLATVNRAIGSSVVSSGACARGGREGCRPNILARAINSPRGKGAARILPKILHTDYLSATVAARREAIRRLV